MKQQILLSEALCGVELIVKHMDDRNIYVNINKIISPNMKHKIVGEGIDPNNDLIIEFEIIFPNKLSQQRKEYLKKLLPINNNTINKDNTVEAIVVDYDDNSNNKLDDDQDNNDVQDGENVVNCTQQ